MNVEHLHNLTDAEFIRIHQDTDDALLAEAVRRLQESAYLVDDHVASLLDEIDALEKERDSLASQLDECDAEMQRMEREAGCY